MPKLFLLTWICCSLCLPLGDFALAQENAAWFVEQNYQFLIDASDFELPAGIVFVPKPGMNPDDALYLVAELRGKIKVVTNERNVKLFTQAPEVFMPSEELPHADGEIGQVGLCMNAKGDALFSTTAASLGRRKKINKIMRWRSDNGWRGGKLDGELVNPFVQDRAVTAHQIGQCMFDGQGHLWVGVGDGKIAEMSHKLESSAGKVLRMHEDFSAVRDNPYYDPAQPSNIKSYVYAFGFRNPFALAEGKDKSMYVADNGNSVDRLVLIEKGKDYPWDNTDQSFIYNNLLVWPKSVGPSDMIYVGENKLFPELAGHLLVLASYDAELWAIPVDPKKGVTGNPKLLVAPLKRPGRKTVFVGLAMGADGVYVTLMRTQALAHSAVMKLVPASSVEAGAVQKSPAQLVEEANCRGCHVLENRGSSVAPNLDELAERLDQRLSATHYLGKLTEVLTANEEFRKLNLNSTQQIIDKRGSLAERMRIWVELKLENPQFDNPEASMPKISLPPNVVKAIAGEVVRVSDEKRLAKAEVSFVDKVKWWSVQYKVEERALWLALGLILGLGGAFAWRRR